MNELLPYEEQLAGKMADISLPGEDKPWDAMRKMLEKDDDDDVIPPPVTKGCRGWGMWPALLLLISVAVIAYKTMHKTNGPVNNAPAIVTNKDSVLSARNNDSDNAKNAGKNTLRRSPGEGNDTGKKAINSDTTLEIPAASNSIIRQGAKGMKRGTVAIAGKTPHAVKGGAQITTRNGLNKTIPGQKDIAIKQSVKGAYGNARQKPAIDTSALPVDATKNVTTVQAKPNPVIDLPGTGKDSLLNGQPTINKQWVIKKDSTKTGTAKKEKEDGEDDNKVWFGAGLGLQQLIPIDGQKAVPYNSFGRKGSLGDYIPSAHFRVYQKKKFLQVELRYGAPQYTKDIEYSKKVLHFDSSSGLTISSVNHVKKTYYHQLPVSIHFNILPNLSMGGGFVWNKFQNAVVEQQTERSIGGVIITDSIQAGTIVNVKKDTTNSFAKSYFQFMVEAQYTWRRFSFGARYSRGVQPYLTFTSPVTGQTQKERNASLQIFLRYELWRSKKK